MLYLLEYRDQAILLPYSRREFKLPGNLVLIGTMNSADRSTALLDQALRRRFSFLDMPPDAAILSEWLRAHPPRDGESFAGRVVQLFEGLNRRLSEDLGASFQVGHSYFMVPDLDESVLRTVWEHQVRPLVQEYFTLQPARATRFEFDELWNGGKRRNGTRMNAE